MNRFHHRMLATVGAAGLVAATLGMTGTAYAAPGDPYVNTTNGKTSTYSVVDTDLTWPEARDAAAAASAGNCVSHLAVITSQDEENYIEQSFPYPAFNTNDVWLGAKRIDADDQGLDQDGLPAQGPFEWITGESFGYTNWNGGEPNNAEPGEPFMRTAIDFRWNDIFANATGRSFVENECTPQGLQVTKVDPSSGFAGDTVTIYGSGFTAPGGTSVFFGAKKSPAITVVNDFTITATVPSTGKPVKKAKAVDVQVKIKNKKSPKTSADKFTYSPESNNT